MTARANIESQAWGDLRFTTLARLCGLTDHDHALVKCAKIWAWQTRNYSPETPTYVVSSDIIESALGDSGADHMVRARLAEEVPEGFRIRGSFGRIEWLWKLSQKGQKGAEATKEKWSRAKADQVAQGRSKRKPKHKTGPVGVAEPTPEPRPLTLDLDLDQNRERVAEPPAVPPPRPELSLSGLPDGWCPTQSAELATLYQTKRDQGVDIDEQLRVFRVHYRGTGEARADWNAWWQKWIMRALPPTKQQLDAIATGKRLSARRADQTRALPPTPAAAGPPPTVRELLELQANGLRVLGHAVPARVLTDLEETEPRKESA